MRKRVIAGNWKMNLTTSEIKSFIEEVKNNLQAEASVIPIVCAPFPYLKELVDAFENTPIKIGAQNMHYAENGAFTGEVSSVMLKDLEVDYVIIGHSERREYFGETNEIINKKILAAFKENLMPILCVGETLEQREANQTLTHIEKQVKKALDGLTREQIGKMIIAYEPIWAIGTGMTASNEDANEVCQHIRSIIEQVTDKEIADQVIIQYGGSVNPTNIKDLLTQSDIDGALVGGASLKADSYLQLLEESKE